MAKKYILSFDQGTSSSRAILYDNNAKIIGKGQRAFSQNYKYKNWVEQDPWEIYNTQLQSAKDLLKASKVSVSDIAALGITNQRETSIVWDRKTGQPIYPAIVWQDKRTEKQCLKLRKKKGDFIREKTGCVVDSYFSATKIQWILDHVEGSRERAKKGELAFGTVDTWMVWNLTKGKSFITDHSNASRTLLFNINTLDWDEELLELFDIPRALLPNLTENAGKLAVVDASIFGNEIIISSLLGDQQAALFGQTCFKKGMLKSTYGTGSFMLMNTGTSPKYSENGLLTTVAWTIKGKTHYAIEGNIFIAGAAIKWLRDNLDIISSVDESEYLAYSVKDSGGVTVIPALAGLGAPYWNNNVQGAIIGLTLGTKKEHIVRATLESLAYRTADMLNLMETESGIKIKSLAVDGGASANNFLMQYISDITRISVDRPRIIETTSLGSAYMAGLAIGFWTEKQLLEIHKVNKSFKPEIEKEEALKLYSEWTKIVFHIIQGSSL
ncbi:MAG: glycerol kinase [Bacteroidetes bacterium]|nr:MAG: glycerol kinase [Bacteroidota bacterium]